MDKCYYYLSNGLWKIVRCYFDNHEEEQNDFFWGMAILPNYNSFGSNIISTPWQQSWATMDILQDVYENPREGENKNETLGLNEITILRREVNFQYVLRNYSSQPFVQQLFTTYARIQTHLVASYSEAEIKFFIVKLKSLLKMLLNECPSSAHSLLQLLFKYGFFLTSCLEAILNDPPNDPAFSCLFLSGLCQSEMIGIHLPFLMTLSQSKFRYELCLLLLANDNVSFLQLLVEEDRKLFLGYSQNNLKKFLKNGFEPLKFFHSMIVMEKHFLFQILEWMKLHIDIFQAAETNCVPSFIWSLMLLQCWNDDSIPVNILPFLIDKCKDSCRDKTVLQIAFILEWHINFSEWYERHNTSDGKKLDKKSDLLEKAKEHSVLYLINNSTDLSETDWNQMSELLKQGKSRAELVKSWDIILFDGYRILIHVIHIILASAEIYNLAKAQRTKLSDITILNGIFSSLYKEEVTEKLDLIKHMIKSLYPLNFRLEILENMFSLIFIQYEDINKLSFASKVSENIIKVLLSKYKFMDKSGDFSKCAKQVSHIDHHLADKTEEDLSKKVKPKGFFCKKFIIRDIIHLVKECLIVLEIDMRSKSKFARSDIPCSIEIEEIESRLDRLCESVNEAAWRLQIVSDPEFVSQIGVMNYGCGQDPFHYFDNDLSCVPHGSDKMSLFKARKKSLERANESDSNTDSSTGNSGGETQAIKLKVNSKDVINQMLASDSSLVIQCLIEGDVLNANHIIQMMGVEENRQTLEGEVLFTEAINDLKKKIQNISFQSPQKKVGSKDGIIKSVSLQSIQMVANQGVTSMALTNHIERFLTVSTMPTIQGASKVPLGSMLQCMENVQAIVTIDLALSSDMTFRDFKSLLNIASKHCPELSTRVQSPISPHTSICKPLGYIVFSQNIIALLQEVNRKQISDSKEEISLHKFLRSPHYSFSLKSLKDGNSFWKQLKQAVADFEKIDAENTSMSQNIEGLGNKYPRNIRDMQKIFENVKKLVESCTELTDPRRSESSTGEISKSFNYSDLLSKYLSDLTAFILENLPTKSDISEPISFRRLLEQSAVDIVDRLIFQYNIEPTVLEKKAQQLGFNLSASLIAGCCPRLPQNNFSGENIKCLSVERVVLNELVSDYKSTDQMNPAEVVADIFSELLIAFKNYNQNKMVEKEISESSGNILTEIDFIELRNDFKIQRILEKTLQLNYVTFETLKENEIVVFFINLLNLMMCHCYLTTKLDPSDGVYSNFGLNRDLGYMFLGYNVGELGFISIFDMKNKLIGEETFSAFSIRQNDEWLKLNINCDPKLIFMITEFGSTSPRLQYITTNKINLEMEKSISLYVEHFVSLKNKHLVITDLLDWYILRVFRREIGKYRQSITDLYNGRIKFLIEFLHRYSSNEFRLLLNEITISDLAIELQPSSKELLLILEYGPGSTYKQCSDQKEEFSEKWKDRNLSDSILRHLSQSSRVLADLVQKIHEAKDPTHMEVARDVLTEEKLKYLDILLGAPWLYQVAPLFDNNPVITALSKYPAENQLNSFFQQCARERKWFKSLDVLFALPDYYMFSNLNLKRLKDIVLKEITISASRKGEEHSWFYSQHISNVYLKLETMKICSKYWSGSVCISQLSSIICDYPNLDAALLEEVRLLIRKIRVYKTMSETVTEYIGKSWYDIQSTVAKIPHIIFKNLIKANQEELCLLWINLPGILESIQKYIDSDFILLAFNHLPNNFELIDQLLNSLSSSVLCSICDNIVYKVKSVPVISHLVKLLVKINPISKYKKLAFVTNLLSDLNAEEQSELVHLISHPILIIEQLLMNMKLDALENILKKIRQETGDNFINQTEVNKLIASYASKAVELNLIKMIKNSDIKQSFLLEMRSQIQQEFIIPAEVPDKSQWIPDNQVSLCMCCLLVSFSMFNRRHHCRRCGRVVCSACSPYQLKIPGYQGVAVRVCYNCYSHFIKIEGNPKNSSNETSVSYNLTQEPRKWKLSTDPNRNATIRDEFSFDYVPNVSLCLAIFNLLPDASYSSVLLDESEKMMKVLQLNGKAGNPEVDCGVVIQIIRSLIIGAKVKYGQASLTTGVVCCDRLLSQVDLLHLLIKNHYSRLIPSESLNGNTLRYLRDKLVEEELWDLAVEVSTKCGLDRNGVWAAWGKVCLAAGSWEEARVKFSYCLDSTTKPMRNPPLVDEICRILESANSFVSLEQKHSERGGSAQEVTDILSNLKWIAQGKHLTFSAVSPKNSMQYNEQIYYLLKYGSHQGLLSFYLKHEEWRLALNYFLEQQLDPDIFVEAILLPSFKTDQQNKLKTEMLAIDSSLETFKKCLCHSCLFLQKSDYLHILYEIQLLMQDFVRAAATCIRLYQRHSSKYKELVARSSYLHSALRHLEEEMASLNKKIKRLDCIMKLEPREVNKHMNTIWRQLEVAKFLGSCEAEGKFIGNFFPDYVSKNEIATLFDGNSERIILSSLIILSGKNITEGFGIAYRIIQDYQLDPAEIYLKTCKKLAEMQRLNDIEVLIDCMKTSGADSVSSTIDQVLGACLPLIVRSESVIQGLDKLIKHITNVDLKISVLIDTRQLKSAYLLAVRYNRLKEVQKIMEVADQMGQMVMKKICMKKLGQAPEGSISSSLQSSDEN